jgi:hypothetical protein
MKSGWIKRRLWWVLGEQLDRVDHHHANVVNGVVVEGIEQSTHAWGVNFNANEVTLRLGLCHLHQGLAIAKPDLHDPLGVG